MTPTTVGDDEFRAPLSASTASDTKPRKSAARKPPSTVDTDTVNKMTYAVTRKQRHYVLRSMTQAAGDDDDETRAYMQAVEQRVYDGFVSAPMHVAFNLYRGELYRQRCFSLLWAIRKHGAYLMARYTDPKLLAALPPHLLVDGTESGADYKAWKEHEERARNIERELRDARANEKGEGWLKCYRCGGAYDTSLLQMRGADEPATLFMTCRNCGFTKRKG